MFRATLAAGVALLTLTACNEQGLHEIEDGYGADDPRIVVEPQTVDFGELAQGAVEIQIFTVKNEGGGDLIVEDIQFGEKVEDQGFSWVFTEDYDNHAFTLAPGASQEVQVQWTPYANQANGIAYVLSNDSEVAEAPVELIGAAQVPELMIDPDPFDFGKTYVGCPREGVIDLVNVGTGDLTISEINWTDNEEWFLNHDLTLPLTLPQDESVQVSVWFDPTSDAAFNYNFSVNSSEPLGTRYADQKGSGKYTAIYKDDFEVPYNPPSDIMFLVDQSCSMDDDQQRLAQNFSYFINNLNTYTNNWHVMVVNDDNGCSNTGVLKPSSSNYADRFASGVSKGGGNHTESLLTPAAEAVHKSGNSGCNAGFLRDGALLHIVAVSDEPEQSQYTSGKSWSTLADEIIAAKGSASLTKISAIAGDYPSGCSSADPGTGYYEAANYTGGEFLSICASSWSSYMTALAEASVAMDTFELTATPVPDTIEVRVNGTDRPGGWTYDEASNSVVITENVPEGGDQIKIVYAGAANCD